MMWSEACPSLGAQANALPSSSAFRLTPRLTQDDLLQVAIRLVRGGGGDGPDFVREVAVVFEALKREVGGPTCGRERLERLAASSTDGGTTCRNRRADALSRWRTEGALNQGLRPAGEEGEPR